MFIDFLLFRRMLMPYLIQFLFYTGAIGAITTGIFQIRAGDISQGILSILFGPILIRIGCEILIVLFKINDSLTEIRGRSTPSKSL